jgi:hypothetical protein
MNVMEKTILEIKGEPEHYFKEFYTLNIKTNCYGFERWEEFTGTLVEVENLEVGGVIRC